MALAGTMVLRPAPVKPPCRPTISRVGLCHLQAHLALVALQLQDVIQWNIIHVIQWDQLV